MIRHATYADDNMSISMAKCHESGRKFGLISNFFVPDDLNFDIEFLYHNEETLKAERGAGYWLWKPMLIYEEITWYNHLVDHNYKEGDWLLYTDAGIEIIADPKILTTVEDDILLFGNHYPHVHWCKGDVIRSILGQCDGSVLQVQASAMMFRPTKRAKDFIYEWLLWSQIPGFIDDSPSKSGNHPEFKEHRHDQAILTCLAEKYGIKRHWWPAIYNDGAFTYDKGTYTDTYPPIFHHHRKRNDEW